MEYYTEMVYQKMEVKDTYKCEDKDYGYGQAAQDRAVYLRKQGFYARAFKEATSVRDYVHYIVLYKPRKTVMASELSTVKISDRNT